MTTFHNCSSNTLINAAKTLRGGGLVAFPTETVYGLGADATNRDAIARVYRVKNRPTEHPLIVHISSMNNLDNWAREIPEYAINLARNFWPGAMTLILPRTSLVKDFVSGAQDSVGVRVPAHPLALALIKEFESQGGLGVAAPSANRFGKVSPTTADAVGKELLDYLLPSDVILDGGTCQIGIESTIIDCTQLIPVILRPGSITTEMIQIALGMEVNQEFLPTRNVKAPGMLANHYSPDAKLFLTGTPSPGDGYIAMADIPSPNGVIRLASPKDNEEYAHILYESLRSADNKGIKHVFVVPPDSKGVGTAINDRLAKAAKK